MGLINSAIHGGAKKEQFFTTVEENIFLMKDLPKGIHLVCLFTCLQWVRLFHIQKLVTCVIDVLIQPSIVPNSPPRNKLTSAARCICYVCNLSYSGSVE